MRVTAIVGDAQNGLCWAIWEFVDPFGGSTAPPTLAYRKGLLVLELDIYSTIYTHIYIHPVIIQ